MFNAQSEPQISTNHIADEAEISPGNLYYHYKNKAAIVEQLYKEHAALIEDALLRAAAQPAKLEGIWLMLHLLFEAVWQYRFFYRDLNHISNVNAKISSQYQRLLKRQVETCQQLLGELVSAKQMDASERELTVISHNIMMAASYWLNYQNILQPNLDQKSENKTLHRGVYQCISMLIPYLSSHQRQQLSAISQVYFIDSHLN